MTLSRTDASASVIERLANQLYREQCRNAFDRDFIPAGALKRLISPDVVSQALLESGVSVQLKGSVRENAERICAEGPRSYRKIFAILVLSQMVFSIPDFISSIVDDSLLPMPDIGTNEEFLPTAYSEDWRIVTRTWGIRDLDFFNTYQWRVLAPVFSGQDLQYTLSPRHVLPFLQIHNEAEGGFGIVYRVSIHPDHHDFGKLEMNAQDDMFALKEIKGEHDDYDHEVLSLSRFRDEKFRHIIHLLASYEVRSKHDARHYLIFPWATGGDLDTFYRRSELFPDRTRMILWIAEQSFGLANALYQIHGDNEDLGTGSPIDADNASSFESNRVYGRHGDIKPSNILWFDQSFSEAANDLGRLVLSDFGLAHYHRRHSRSNVQTSTVPRSATYRAPEFDTSESLSRKTDVWSLGCLFLDMLTWLLRGYQVMHEDFSRSRLEENSELRGLREDTFFRIVCEGVKYTAIVKPSVTVWIKSLHDDPRCSTYVGDFLSLIEHYMIVVDLKQRISAAKLSQELEYMYFRCINDDRYYREGALRPLGVPVSLRPTSKSAVVGNLMSSSPLILNSDFMATSEPPREGAASPLEPEDQPPLPRISRASTKQPTSRVRMMSWIKVFLCF